MSSDKSLPRDIENYADVTLDLIQKNGGTVAELTPEKERKLKIKLWLTIVPIAFLVNATLFIDKDAVTFSSLLGLFDDMGISSPDYNNIQTFFYLGYFVGQAPSHYLFQRFPVSKFISATLAVWAILSFCTLGCKSYAGMAVLRFLLGAFESGITPCVEHTLAMFFTLEEQAFVNPVFWISCLGIDLPFAFVAYGLQYTTKWRPWKWYWLLIGIISSVVSVVVYFIYPDNPALSRLFTTEEKIHIIQRVKKQSRSSIEQKTFKKYQFVECLKDPISWLFVLFCLMNMLENSTSYQSSIIYTELGFGHLTSTLLIAVTTAFSISCACAGAFALSRFRKQSVFVAVVFTWPALLGAILAVSIPWDNKPGILGGIFMTRSNGTAYIISFSLCQTTAAGHTKKLTRTLLFMLAYAVSNMVCPQMWRTQYQPRYRIPWIMQMVFSWFLAPCCLLTIRYILSKRNKERRRLIEEEGEDLDYGFIDSVDENGDLVKDKVDVSMLDLTDLENKRFIYPL
ncbi:hypothetical protein CANTEDRAFT_132545 [Yamadazyma tenuis ATCC 10573]|uniref:MFS general substrate transporter n=1 Tax=Candida tenuis (strain ATCC 10573 / BCRC 21748 / CBS 615 / JCM 9827 / NBRC 10315 / NRRL Y-1498 / VKM Y-70) TaxID=590646 RepID=G3BD36_CANTC|nr:uncharacterized protein CANTEDRAFT_132545 [Yamadazyma tenuis ATCC 10573]EGV60910.1 hypothetical protein CANTEDRAFT_132545 [Yamadazyma tenuis ATCC 10573]